VTSPESESAAKPVDPFGPAPLIPGENAADYNELLARISGLVKPADILEEIWVREIVDLAWEAFRLRRQKATLMTANAYRGVEKVLRFLDSGFSIKSFDLAKAWRARDRGAIEEVDELLASAGLSMDEVMAETLALVLDHVERIDHMIERLELRRNGTLHEVDRHREALGRDLRWAAQQVEDGELRAIEDKAGTDRSAHEQ
jgi:hypothetical protein